MFKLLLSVLILAGLAAAIGGLITLVVLFAAAAAAVGSAVSVNVVFGIAFGIMVVAGLGAAITGG